MSPSLAAMSSGEQFFADAAGRTGSHVQDVHELPVANPDRHEEWGLSLHIQVVHLCPLGQEDLHALNMALGGGQA